jgi:AraC-like DNA-binding protein
MHRLAQNVYLPDQPRPLLPSLIIQRLGGALARTLSNQMIRSCLEEEFSLEDLAEKIDLSLSRFKARFKSEMGIGPHEFMFATRSKPPNGPCWTSARQ